MSSPKVIFIDNPFFAVNNKDNNFLLYKGKDKTGKRIFKQCKNKNDYSVQAKNYLFGNKGFMAYSRNEEKANITLEKCNSSNLFDYMMGGKKDISIMEINTMKREQMMMDKFGNFVTDSEADKKNFYWSKLFNKSNIHLSVLSFNKDYVDENISIDNLQKEITTKIMPMFLKQCGYQNPYKIMDWIVALHKAFDRNNYHFHIGFIEKRESYLGTDNKLHFKQRLNLNDREMNFIKRQSILAIERAKVFTPELIKLNKSFEQFKKYFNPKEKSFSLRHIKNIDLEYKILRLGYLLNKFRKNNPKKIKYNSLPKNGIGKEIRLLTKDIKKELFNNKDIQLSKQKINEHIEEINNIFLKIDKDNLISNIGFENAKDSKLIKDKLEKYDNYVLNAIVNNSLYVYHNRFATNQNISLNDLLNEAILLVYLNEKKTNNENQYILKNSFQQSYPMKKAIYRSFKKLKYEQDKIAEQFYEMFSEKNNLSK